MKILQTCSLVSWFALNYLELTWGRLFLNMTSYSIWQFPDIFASGRGNWCGCWIRTACYVSQWAGATCRTENGETRRWRCRYTNTCIYSTMWCTHGRVFAHTVCFYVQMLLFLLQMLPGKKRRCKKGIFPRPFIRENKPIVLKHISICYPQTGYTFYLLRDF